MRSAAGSALLEMGRTRVLCAASISDKVPDWMNSTGRGWVTAEYGMLPASTAVRREASRTRPDSRSLEIQRLIGRCLRAVTNLEALGQRTIWIDCDVIEADGGTRTAAVTGAYIAMHDALQKLVREGVLSRIPLMDSVAAVSVGMVKGEILLDLDYSEDSAAEVDMNVAMTGSGKIVEIQGTAEKTPFDTSVLDEMLALARKGIVFLTRLQQKCFEEQPVLSSRNDG